MTTDPIDNAEDDDDDDDDDDDWVSQRRQGTKQCYDLRYRYSGSSNDANNTNHSNYDDSEQWQ